MSSSEDVKTGALGPCWGGHRRRHYFWIPFAVAGVVFLKAAVVMWLWNALIPDLFHGPLVTYWQAMGLAILAMLLFRLGPGGHFGGWRHGGRWRRYWANLPEVEREKLREQWRKQSGQ